MAAAARKATTTTAPTTVTKTVAATATTDTTHDMLVAVGLMAVFVLIMTMVAGIGPKSGRFAVAVMVLLFVGQAVTHVNPFVTWAENHPLTPGNTTVQQFTANGLS